MTECTAEEWQRVSRRGVRAGECLIWTGSRTSGGYGNVRHRGRNEYAHRLALAFHLRRALAPKALACHTCDTPSCFEPTHLYEGTEKTNLRDAKDRGRWTGEWIRRIGEDHKQAKVTEEDVRRVRALRADGWTARAIAEELGGKISRANVSMIYTRKTWTHIP